ncbi:MAG TPA: 2OG-Fe(II) oxygenase [Sphingomicrobium sp.]|jgi:hypothetical protein|nr:2OG-Fe(II) oxygenase [Sphingomicrobium sp.]
MATVGPMPPHAQLSGFLPEAEHDAILAWAISEQESFSPAKVFLKGGAAGRVDPERRIALKRYGMGPFEPLLSERLFDAYSRIAPAAGYKGPRLSSLQFELNAYGEGAHFAPHFDIPLGNARRPIGERPGEDRLITAVYYFRGEPRGFSGGALRLYRFGADHDEATDGDSIAFEPERNSLLVFPSWARHGVETVHCPSGLFRDYRFGLNCWFCGRLGG